MPVSHRDSTTARQHVTTACTPCRRSKIKCDGVRPSCGQCKGRKRQCLFQPRADKRKISLRKTIQAFSSRVNQLQDFILASGLEVPATPNPDHATTINELMAAYSSSCSEPIDFSSTVGGIEPLSDLIMPDAPGQEPQIADHNSTSSGQQAPWLDDSGETMAFFGDGLDGSSGNLPPSASTVDADWLWNLVTMDNFSTSIEGDFGAAALLDAPLGNNIPVPANLDDVLVENNDVANPQTIAEAETSNDEEEHSEVTHAISDRLGRLLGSGGGDWRYYGATSNLHLVHSRHVLVSRHRRASYPAETYAKLQSVGFAHDISPEVQGHLIQLYFTWHNASLQIVDQDAFLEAQENYVSDGTYTSFYSEVLVNAMCAVGAAFDENKHHTLPAPLSEFFANRAKALLDVELDDPRVATIQGLAVLSCHEASCIRDTRAWIFSGMAIRLAFDLGLHASTKAYVDGGAMSQREAKARSRTLWGCFINDCNNGIYLGRSSQMGISGIAVERPGSFGPDQSVWSPYGLVQQDAEFDGSMASPRDLLLDRWIALYEIMNALGHSLYMSQDASKVELQDLAEKTFDSLLAWRSSLTPELALNTGDLASTRHLPQVLTLHMQYNLLVIVLHRPFCAKRYIQPQPLIGKGPLHAREMCIRSAVEISTLISCYKSQYTLCRASVQLVHVTFTAALILVYAIISGVMRDLYPDLSSHLDVCCQALADMGEAFENSARALDILLAIKRSWQARMVSSFGGAAGKKRAESHSSSQV